MKITDIIKEDDTAAPTAPAVAPAADAKDKA